MPNFKSERILAESARDMEPRKGILPMIRADNLKRFGVVVSGRFMPETWVNLITRLEAKRFDIGDWDRPKTVWVFDQSDIDAVRLVVQMLDVSDIVKPRRQSKAALRRAALVGEDFPRDEDGDGAEDDDLVVAPGM